MQYDVSTPADYIKALDGDWRKEKLLLLRQLILHQDSAIDESINYKMLCYTLHQKGLFHLNAQKGYVSLYCGNTEKVDPQGALLAGLKTGKGCIRFTKRTDIAATQIEAFIARATARVKEGKDVGC
ncbi:DUF1801 domain-containing protein [Alteromonas halophila]|uniref:YdhG-like domain-containing protein n=1 Tax=Alteromonas halophila TaxID=516698 RepID=A0A918MWI0_9ALTE|nr:DUF1801 domain-containing protein [Alteromonas halophila]GGW76374.1 hypothetical protein GCM10007391_06230 [Alteromonas halophila]